MKNLLSLFLVGSSFYCLGQKGQIEIDKQVWRPFTKAWESRDAKAFNNVHTDDIIRIGSKELLIGDEYKNRNIKSMVPNEDRPKRIIEFAFDKRLIKGDVAYEVGFYRVSGPDMSNDFYARFHVELRKNKGVWKIARDFDTSQIGASKVSKEMCANVTFDHYN
jgi:ketosteroid isomerase-like protein